MKRPPRTLVNWLRAPSDISTERTRAWSPPTRACDTLRVGGGAPVWTAPAWVTPIPGVSGPGGLTGGRNLPLLRFLPLRLTDPSLEARPKTLDERFGDPGGPDPSEAPSSGASALSMRERAAHELNPEMGRMGAEDPSTAFSAVPLVKV